MPVEPNFDLAQFVQNLDFIVPQATIPALRANKKNDALREMVDALVNAGTVTVKSREDLLAALIKREELGSTGIGNGVAVPHVKHAGVERVVGNIAWAPAGIDFGAVDRQSVYLVILIVFPAEHGGAYLRALETVSRLLRELPRPLVKKPT